MINLARQVHQQADDAEDPDGARKPGARRHDACVQANLLNAKSLIPSTHVGKCITGRASRRASHGSSSNWAAIPPRPRRWASSATCWRRSAATEPATLNQVAAKVRRGAPAVSRAIDSLVRAGLVDRQPDPDNRRRLALRLTEAGAASQSAAGRGQLARRPHRQARGQRTSRARARDRNPRTLAALGVSRGGMRWEGVAMLLITLLLALARGRHCFHHVPRQSRDRGGPA